MVFIGLSAALVFAKPTGKGLFNVDFDKTGWGGLEVGRNIVILTVTDATDKAVEGAGIKVTPWMPMMNHGIPIKPTVHDLEGGKEDNATLVFKDVSN